MGDSKALTREDILDARETREVEIEYEALDGSVWVQPLPFSLGHKLVQRATENGADGDSASLDISEILDDLLIHGVVDEDGDRLFTDADREAVGNLPFRPAMTMAMEVLDVSGLTAEAEEAIEGNLETGQTD